MLRRQGLTDLLIIILFNSFVLNLQAQDQNAQNESKKMVHLGLGLGLDYGGIGVQVGVRIVQPLNVFGGLGYNFESVGYNIGLQGLLPSSGSVTPIVEAMYGYNGVIVVQDFASLNKTYYGPSFGGGVHFKLPANENHFFAVKLLVPFRSQEFKDDFNALDNSGVFEVSRPWPVNVSFGYHFKF